MDSLHLYLRQRSFGLRLLLKIRKQFCYPGRHQDGMDNARPVERDRPIFAPDKLLLRAILSTTIPLRFSHSISKQAGGRKPAAAVCSNLERCQLNNRTMTKGGGGATAPPETGTPAARFGCPGTGRWQWSAVAAVARASRQPLPAPEDGFPFPVATSARACALDGSGRGRCRLWRHHGHSPWTGVDGRSPPDALPTG